MKKFTAILLVVFILVAAGGMFYLALESDSVVTFYVDGEEYKSITADRKAKTITLPDAPSKDGFVFEGWFFDENTLKDAYTDTYYANLKKLPAKIHLYAKFASVCAHTAGVTDWIVETDATCTAEGTRVQKCQSCDAVLNSGTIEKKDHNYNGTLDYTVKNGEKAFSLQLKCKGCGASKKFDNLTVNAGIQTPATCTSKGKSKYTYAYEGTTYTCIKEDIPAQDHKLNGVPHMEVVNDGGFSTDMEGIYLSAAIETPDCGTECDAYYSCSACKAIIKVTAKKAHVGTWTETKPTSCKEAGEKTLAVCIDCGETNITAPIAKLAHEYTWELTSNDYKVFTLTGVCVCKDPPIVETVAAVAGANVKPTCLENGSQLYFYVFEGVKYTCTEVLPKLEHKLNGKDISTYKDENGGIKLGTEGVYHFGKLVDFKCNEVKEGGGYFICSDCNHNISTDVYKPHTWKAWETVTPSTCLVEGDKKRGCEDCDAPPETGKIDRVDHTYAYTLHYDAAEDRFYLIGACTTKNCDAKDETQNDVAVTHKALSTNQIEYTYKTETFTCKMILEASANNRHTRGGYTFHEMMDENGKLDYTKWGSLGVIVFVDDDSKTLTTCMKDYEGALVCEECKVTYSITVYRGHDVKTWTTAKEPTCSELGKKQGVCQYKDCGKTIEEDIEMLPHTYDYTFIPDASGDLALAKVMADCKKCDASHMIEDFDSDPVYDGVVNDPTCMEDGMAKYTCEKDGIVYEAYIVVALDPESDGHAINGKKAEDLQNADGSFNAGLAGIHIMENAAVVDGFTQGGYICSHCNRFVEVTVKK